MTKYAEMERICDVLFGIFTIVWIITRLGVYPVYILNRFDTNYEIFEFLISVSYSVTKLMPYFCFQYPH
jgi:hypothetical protein